MSETPNDKKQNLSDLEDSIQEKTQRALLSVKRRFANPGHSFLILAALTVIITISYMLFTQYAGNDETNEEEYLKNLVTLSDAGYLQLSYKDAPLESRYSRVRINNIKQLIEADLDNLRTPLFRQRVGALEQAAYVLCAQDGKTGNLPMSPPIVVAQLARSHSVEIEIIPNNASISRTERCGGSWTSGLPEQRPSDAMFERKGLVAESIIFFKALDARPGGASDYGHVIKVLKAQKEAEHAVIEDAKAELIAVEDNLSFGFLSSGGEDAWIFHLIVWSWFGVIASSLVGMSTSIIQGKYDGLMFGFVWMKFILAPLIATVVAAVFGAGLTQNEFNLAHQPIFLMFAFFSGFFSERFTETLRMAANAFFAAARVDKDSFDRVTKRGIGRYRPTLPRIAVDRPAASLPSLRTTLEAVGANAIADLAEDRMARKAIREDGNE